MVGDIFFYKKYPRYKLYNDRCSINVSYSDQRCPFLKKWLEIFFSIKNIRAINYITIVAQSTYRTAINAVANSTGYASVNVEPLTSTTLVNAYGDPHFFSHNKNVSTYSSSVSRTIPD